MKAAALFVVLVASVPAIAGEDPPVDRLLGNHLFQLPTLQRSAFVETSFGVRQGGAIYSVEPGEVALLGGRKLELIGITEGASLSVRLIDWLGLELGASGSAVVGSNVRSILIQGGTVSFEGDAGVIVRPLRLEGGTQLALRAFGGRRTGRNVGLLPLLGATVGQPGATVEDAATGSLSELISMPVKEWSLGGGVYAAQAFGQFFALQGSVSAQQSWITESPFDPGLDTRVDRDSDSLFFNAGLAAGVDFISVKVPVALLAEFVFSSGRRTEFTGAETTLNISNLGLGIFYSGRPHLQLGVSASMSLGGERVRILGPSGGLERSGDPTLYTGQFVFRYFW